MRTTLEIADDVLQAARELAATEGQTIGVVLSRLARAGLSRPERSARTRNGVPLLPRRPPATPGSTMKLVNDLRDEA